MDPLTAWLAGLGEPEPEALAAALAALPGRPPHGPGPPRGPLDAMEWSLRERAPGARWAYNLAAERLAPGAVRTFLERRGALPAAVAGLLDASAGADQQIGGAREAGRERSKLYLYARGAPPDLLERLCGAVGAEPALAAARAGGHPAFGAIDLGGALAGKVYVEHASVAGAAAHAERVGAGALAALGRALPAGLGAPPAVAVLSVRARGGCVLDHTLHLKIDRAPERLAELAGAALAAEAADLFRRATRLGRRLRPTYVSFLQAPDGAVGRTVYYRLEAPR